VPQVTEVDDRQPSRGRLLVRTGVALAVTLLAVLLAPIAPSSAAPPTNDPETAGGFAAGWLASQLDAGIPMQNFGSPDWGVTLDAAISLAATETGSA
jgi:hypothetical protein